MEELWVSRAPYGCLRVFGAVSRRNDRSARKRRIRFLRDFRQEFRVAPLKEGI